MFDTFSYLIFALIFRDTYVERIRGESPNDYNDRMIRVAALWYNKHLNGKVKVLLLSSDEANKAKAINEGIPTMSCKYLVTCMFLGTCSVLMYY